MEKVSTSTNFCSRGINRSSLEKELENEIRVHVGRKVTISTKKIFFHKSCWWIFQWIATQTASMLTSFSNQAFSY